MTARHLRPSPDRIIEANRPHRQPDDNHAGLMIGIGVALFLVMLGLVLLDGVARAFVRPEGCLTLSAQECAAMLQERAVR